VVQALQTIHKLGTGVTIMNEQYLCTVPFAMSNDVADLLEIAETVKSTFQFSNKTESRICKLLDC